MMRLGLEKGRENLHFNCRCKFTIPLINQQTHTISIKERSEKALEMIALVSIDFVCVCTQHKYISP